jgi:hypothetical protein
MAGKQYSNGSHVALATGICAVCGRTYETGEVLLHKGLEKVFPGSGKAPPTEYGLCEEHQKKYNEGYVALVGIDPEKCEAGVDVDEMRLDEVYRTGLLVFVRAGVWDKLFNVPLPLLEDGRTRPMVFVPDEVIHILQGRVQKDQDDGNAKEDG